MKEYELLMLVNQDAGEENFLALIAKIEDKIKALGGEVTKTDNWGLKRLAYTMQKPKKTNQAYYALINFSSEPSLPAEIQKTLKVTEAVIRYGLSLAVKKVPEKEVKAAENKEEIQPVHVGEIKSVEEGENLG